MKWRVLLVAASFCAATLVFFLYQIVDRGPYDGPIPPITHEYFVCDKCRSLDGGIYGKGPHKRLRTAAGSRCIHNCRISSFRALAEGMLWARAAGCTESPAMRVRAARNREGVI